MYQCTSFFRYGISLLTVLFLLFPIVTFAQTDDDAKMENKLEELADDLSTKLTEDEIKSVRVADFTGGFLPQATGGVGLKHKVIEALKGRGIEVTDRADFELQGHYQIIKPENAFDPVTMRISILVWNRAGKVLNELSTSIDSDSDNILKLVGATGELPPKAEVKEREGAKRKAIEKAEVAIIGKEVRTSEHSPYGIEIIVVRGNKKVLQTPIISTRFDQSMAFVPLEENDKYIVRLHNRSDKDIAVSLNIDGLDMYAFGELKTTGYPIVSAKSHHDIQGWYIDKKNTDVFLVSSYAKSAAAALGKPPAGIGTITASFHDTTPASPPEPIVENAVKTTTGSSGTARGERIEVIWEEKPVLVLDILAVISVRYNRE